METDETAHIKTVLNHFPFFEILFNRSRQNSILIINTNGIIVDVNKNFLKTFGYTAEELIGKKNNLLFTHEDRELGLPEIEMQKVLSEGQAKDNNYLLNQDHSRTWVAGESVLVENRNGEKIIVKIIQNIQQIKLSEASLRVMNEFNENILGSIEDIVIVIDQNNEIIKSNREIKDVFRVGEDKDTNNLVELLKDHVDQSVHNHILDCIGLEEGFKKTEIELENSLGEKNFYTLTCCPLINSEERRVLVVIHDITEQKHAEREREDIIGFVAHELRNPLANIVLCHEILNDAIENNNTNEMNDMLQRSKNNVMRLNKMIAELYEATKANAGNLLLDIKAFNFQDMITESVETIKSLQPFYNIIIKGNGNIDVHGDKFRLHQVVTNFLSNGIKYSNGSRVVLLTVSHDDKNVTVSVRDEGLGISASQLPFIFERFFRAERTKNLEGIGLGLYLCRQIIYRHHGKIWAESEEGKGSTFYFTIPIQST
jgi:PAS domain S-box-containing protein